MTLQIYNSLTRTKEPFEPLQTGEVRMYVCGPTVYDEAHVGHGMSSLVFDVVRRYLEFKGFRVLHVMNYTDVDDKVINRAQELGVDALELAEGYIREYRQHLLDLNVLPAMAYPRVSREIDTILEMVSGLVDKGFAYDVDGDVYFRVERDEDYGKLSGRKLEEMRAGARLAVDERKEDPADFALWKAAKEGEPSWESPWGSGRPGWHIECSAMSYAYLGGQIDIHGGGSDLVFPHHENEIAQTESFTGKPFAQFWMHNGMLRFTGEKMSKSVGNVISIAAFLEDYDPDVLRMIILNSSYRSPLAFNEEVIEAAERGLERLRTALGATARIEGSGETQANERLAEQADEAEAGFSRSMDDDFNTAGALSHLFNLAREINKARDAGAGEESLTRAREALQRLGGILGLRLEEARRGVHPIEPVLEILLEIRQRLREEKHFELADEIRDRLAAEGIAIEDSEEGSRWRLEG